MATFRQTEAGFWKLFRDRLKKDFLFDRIESVTGVGVPDVYWVARDGAANGWMELKVVRGRKVRFGQEQIHWINDRVARGVCVWIAARHNREDSPRSGAIYLWRGEKAAGLAKSSIVEVPPDHSFEYPFQWGEVGAALKVPREG